MQYLQQVHKLLWIDWMLSTNQIFDSESDV